MGVQAAQVVRVYASVEHLTSCASDGSTGFPWTRTLNFYAFFHSPKAVSLGEHRCQEPKERNYGKGMEVTLR